MHPTPARAASLSSSAAGRIARLWRAHAAFLVTAAVLLALILGLTSMAEEVYEIATEEDGVVGVDRPALDAATGMRGPVLTAVAQALAWTGGTVGATILALAVLAGFTLARRNATPAALLVPGMAGAVLLTTVGKGYVGRIRPPAELALPPLQDSPAFPSGHTLNATVFMALTVYLVIITRNRATGDPVRRRWLAVVAVAAALYAVVMGLSRVYLGAHWLSDVMAGWAVGLAWALAVVLAHRVWLTLHRR